MKLFFKYINSKKLVLLYALLCIAIFFICFSLYGFPASVIAYPTALCLSIGLMLLLLDFFKVQRKYKEIEFILQKTAEMVEKLPKSKDICENEYIKLINKLCEDYIQLQTSKDSSYKDMIDYYTVWAHQIKTPIASMKLTLMNEDSELSRKINSDLSKIMQYVEMVLAFLRLDSEANDYVFKEYNLDEIIKPCIRKFSGEFISRKLSLNYEPTELKIITDEKWLDFVVGQLLSNALKYTKTGGIHIYSRDSRLFIEDTGMGIAKEDLPRIFEKGYTGFNGRSDKNASGLGLFLCKKICDRLGILIEIDSEIGKGTRVCLTFSKDDTKYE